MTTRQYQSCSIKPSRWGYTATFGLCDHLISGDYETVDRASTEHMATCPPPPEEFDEREERHQLPDGHQGIVGTLCFLALDGCTDPTCPCSCHR